MTERINPEMVGVVTLALTQAVSVFNAFLPPLTEVRRSSKANRTALLDVRIGEVAASLMVVGIGAVLSTLIGNTRPLWVSVAGAAGMMTVYEYALRSSDE
jgi:hypothetical protein